MGNDNGMADIVIASNRGPIAFHRAADGAVVAARGGGGLVTGLAGLPAEGSTVWVCAALSDTDREVAAAAPGGRLDLAGHTTDPVQMLAIDAETFSGAYNTISNQVLWYVHHGLNAGKPLLPNDSREWQRDWTSYVDYNAAFADAIAAEASDRARVLAQDYHLTVLPAMLRARRPDLRVGLFTHTPWSTATDFALLPAEIANELLVGMLGADSLGFHSPRWAEDFIDCCVRILGAERGAGDVRYDGRSTAVRVHPLGVDPAPLLARAAQPDVAAHRAAIDAMLGDRQAIVRVDRTEPSKNIARGLSAYRDLLERYPEHRERVVHVAIAYPSRQDIADYRHLAEEIETLAGEINDAFSTDTWTPVQLSVVNDYPESLATLAAGDVALVNPIRDGMNLVAKEATVLSDDGVLVLSRNAGAADAMGEFALLIDPFDIAGTADALHAALVMPAAERARRHTGLLAAATAHPPREWLRQQLDAL